MQAPECICLGTCEALQSQCAILGISNAHRKTKLQKQWQHIAVIIVFFSMILRPSKYLSQLARTTWSANTSICNIRLLDTPFSAEIAEANSVRTDKLAAQTIYTSTASCLVHRAALIVCLPGSQPSENLAQVACATRPRKHTIWIFYASTASFPVIK
mmetsp:Transcript_113314/g.283827  ORF Transcript_113314/g.283827 Transcript_113314/m.283827 type:complete len:157 (+) Transcript_113314:520-990(+)